VNVHDGSSAPVESWQSLSAASRAVLIELIVGGASPRVELAKRLGASKSSLTRSTRTLVARGLIVEGATELRSALGRPSEILDVAADTLNFAGVKLTGDRLYAVVTDLGATVIESREELLASTAPDAVIDQIGGVVDQLRVRHPRILALGVTLAGSIVHDGAGQPLLEESEFLGWRDLLFADLLMERTGMMVAIENDVHALTAAEHWFGAGAGLESMVMITVGEGIGCGLVAHGQMVSGAHGLAGRINHQLITAKGPRCGIGHTGCASAYLTNSAIARAASRAGESAISYPVAVERARAGDRAAIRAFGDAGFALGTLIGVTANYLDPARVVISGDGIAVWELAHSRIADGVSASSGHSIESLDIRVRQFDFGEWARSAAVLALRASLAA
jgi:predicted NBD/HSP70 family sugar kinase